MKILVFFFAFISIAIINNATAQISHEENKESQHMFLYQPFADECKINAEQSRLSVRDTVAKPAHKSGRFKRVEKPNAFFIAPLNTFNLVYPNFQIGYERIIAEKWALQIEGGIMYNQRYQLFTRLFIWVLSNERNSEPPSNTNHGFRVLGSVKYVIGETKISKIYISPELYYTKTKSKIKRSFLVSDPNFEYSFGLAEFGSSYYHEFYNVEEKMGLNFKLGSKLYFGNCYLDFHVGLGVGHRNVVQTGKENPDDKISDIFNELYLGFLDKASPNKWALTLPFNLKIGLRF